MTASPLRSMVTMAPLAGCGSRVPCKPSSSGVSLRASPSSVGQPSSRPSVSSSGLLHLGSQLFDALRRVLSSGHAGHAGRHGSRRGGIGPCPAPASAAARQLPDAQRQRVHRSGTRRIVLREHPHRRCHARLIGSRPADPPRRQSPAGQAFAQRSLTVSAASRRIVERGFLRGVVIR